MADRSDLHTKLASIRERQGLPPMPDPTVIQGFGPGDPPSPTFDPDRARLAAESASTQGYDLPEPGPNKPEDDWVNQEMDLEMDLEDAESPPEPERKLLSPLVPRHPRAPTASPQAHPRMALEPSYKLMVKDYQATYDGRTVRLSDSEAASIAGKVLRALERAVRDQLKELGQLRKRTQRKSLTQQLAEPMKTRGRRRKQAIQDASTT